MNTRFYLTHLLFAAAFTAGAASEAVTGYTDTPLLPGQSWRVHDASRPQPRTVTPGATFSDMAPAPADALVLFDGTDLSKWTVNGAPPKWKVENGYMEVVKGGSIRTRDEFGDFQLHLEFASPQTVKGEGQGRGNSGLMIYGRYEVQILDSHQNRTYADGHVGSMYGQYPPLANAARPPGAWQTMDVLFESARWDDAGKLIKPANVTILLNGVVLQHKQNFIGSVRHRDLASYGKPHPPKGPIVLQEHGDPVRFRNIWIRPIGEYDKE